MKMRCASFFAGVGGIDIAFEQAGFEIVYANELDKFAVETFKANHKTFTAQRPLHSFQSIVYQLVMQCVKAMSLARKGGVFTA